uniref:Neur_chan_memb domain-containing protein n=1 Tax=Macrostomum lignano TaxID=282301 RepID=A0A1I8GG98_9PLAT
VQFKRVSTYYLISVITPLLLLTLLQVLVYFVPLESGEKLGFGITIMLSYTVFLLLLDGILPKSQSTPAIASFITSAMILSTVSLLLTSLIMRFHYAPEGTKMPACARGFFVRFLGRVFCVNGSSSAQVGETPTADAAASESSVRKMADSAPVAKSEWIVASYAIERLMVALGVFATAAIIGHAI